MDILAFDISGKFAHFRKFFANNTAFTYSIPPRTSIMGMIGAIVGFEKEQYHEAFATQNLLHTVRVLAPLKKSFHRVNFLSIKTANDFSGRAGRIQTPFEILSGPDIKKHYVSYRVYLTAGGHSESSFNLVKEHLLNKAPVFNPTLGPANFNANISNIQLFEPSHIKEKQCDNEWITLHSSVSVENVKDLAFEKGQQEKYNFIEQELMPAEFVANGNREVGKMDRLLYTTDNIPLRIQFSGRYYELEKRQLTEKIQFIE